jgi:hypothetical protein
VVVRLVNLISVTTASKRFASQTAHECRSNLEKVGIEAVREFFDSDAEGKIMNERQRIANIVDCCITEWSSVLDYKQLVAQEGASLA